MEHLESAPKNSSRFFKTKLPTEGFCGTFQLGLSVSKYGPQWGAFLGEPQDARISRGDSEARLNLESLETGKCDPGGDWNPGRSIRIPFPKAQSFFRKLLPSAIHRIVVHNPGSRKQEEIWYWRWVRIFQTSFYVKMMCKSTLLAVWPFKCSAFLSPQTWRWAKSQHDALPTNTNAQTPSKNS